jgi:hypothetical protein
VTPAEDDVKATPKAEAVRKIAPVGPPPSKPQIPKLNIKAPALQGGSSNPLVSQSARVDGTTPIQPRGQLAALQNPATPHNTGAATARPAVPTDQFTTPSHPSASSDQEGSAPKRGIIIRGTTIDSGAHEAVPNQVTTPAAGLSIVANGVGQLPPVEAERPTTRRNKSRGSKAPDAGGLSSEDYRSDGPGMGKIPSADQISVVAGAGVSADQPRPIVPKEPLAPREPPKSGGSAPSAGGRRGKNIIPASSPAAAEEQQPTNPPPSSLVPTPPSKPKPSAVTTLTDPRSIYQGRQGISAKPIQPLVPREREPVPRVPSAPSSKPPDVSARALAQKNKQSQQGGSLSLSMETPPLAVAVAALVQPPPSVLVS